MSNTEKPAPLSEEFVAELIAMIVEEPMPPQLIASTIIEIDDKAYNYMVGPSKTAGLYDLVEVIIDMSQNRHEPIIRREEGLNLGMALFNMSVNITHLSLSAEVI